jgi:hypothetical protein
MSAQGLELLSVITFLASYAALCFLLGRWSAERTSCCQHADLTDDRAPVAPSSLDDELADLVRAGGRTT